MRATTGCGLAEPSSVATGPGHSMPLHDDEVSVDADLVGRLVASQFPQLAGLPVRRTRSTGTVNAIFRIGEQHYARMPLVARWAGDLERELAWLPHLAPQLPLPVPRPVGRGAATAEYPLAWAVFEWMGGEPYAAGLLDEALAAGDLARFVRALRSVARVGGEPAAGRGRLTDLDVDTRAALDAADRLGLVDGPAATAAWNRAIEVPPFRGDGAVWIHADLLPPNLLVHEGRLAAVIDFGSAGVGDPAADVIAAWTLFGPAGRSAFREALAVDDAMWERGRGYALTQAAMIVPYYVRSNPAFSAMACRTIAEVVADAAPDAAR